MWTPCFRFFLDRATSGAAPFGPFVFVSLSALAASRRDAGASCVVTVCLAAPAECSPSVSSGPSSADADWSFRPAASQAAVHGSQSLCRVLELFSLAVRCGFDRTMSESSLPRRARFLVPASSHRRTWERLLLFSSLCLRVPRELVQVGMWFGVGFH